MSDPWLVSCDVSGYGVDETAGPMARIDVFVRAMLLTTSSRPRLLPARHHLRRLIAVPLVIAEYGHEAYTSALLLTDIGPQAIQCLEVLARACFPPPGMDAASPLYYREFTALFTPNAPGPTPAYRRSSRQRTPINYAVPVLDSELVRKLDRSAAQDGDYEESRSRARSPGKLARGASPTKSTRTESFKTRSNEPSSKSTRSNSPTRPSRDRSPVRKLSGSQPVSPESNLPRDWRPHDESLLAVNLDELPHVFESPLFIWSMLARAFSLSVSPEPRRSRLWPLWAPFLDFLATVVEKDYAISGTYNSIISSWSSTVAPAIVISSLLSVSTTESSIASDCRPHRLATQLRSRFLAVYLQHKLAADPSCIADILELCDAELAQSHIYHQLIGSIFSYMTTDERFRVSYESNNLLGRIARSLGLPKSAQHYRLAYLNLVDLSENALSELASCCPSLEVPRPNHCLFFYGLLYLFLNCLDRFIEVKGKIPSQLFKALTEGDRRRVRWIETQWHPDEVQKYLDWRQDSDLDSILYLLADKKPSSSKPNTRSRTASTDPEVYIYSEKSRAVKLESTDNNKPKKRRLAGSPVAKS